MSRSVRWLSILGTLLVAAPLGAAELYSVADLGSLGNPRGSGAVALNGAGDAVGYAFVSGSTYVHAVLNHKGTVVDLGTLGGSQSLARSVNVGGMVAGWAYPAGSTYQHATVWNGGVATDLGTFGGTFSDAHDVNDAGIVVGSSFDGAGDERAFWWDGALHDLGTLGGRQARAYAINNWGDIVGMAAPPGNDRFHAFFAKAGSPLYDLGTLGGNTSYAYDVNENRHACGWSQVGWSPTASRGFFWADGVMKEVGTAGGEYSAAFALNDHDEVVGMTSRADGQYVAFVWKNGQLSDLNTLLPQGTGWTLSRAWDIDENGVIVGEGTLNGEPRAFVLAPASATSVPPAQLPSEVRFARARPHPVAGPARFDFELPAPARAHLELYDLSGRRVREVADGWFPAGRTSLAWDGLDASGSRPASGLYWASLTVDGRRWTRQVAVAN
jgi:probable HAF family extracellular repeat protein